MRIGLAALVLAAAPALAADPPGMVTKTYPIGDLIFTATAAPAKAPPAVAPAPVVTMAVPLPAVPPLPRIAPAPVAGVMVAVPPPMAPATRRNADNLVRLVPAMIKPTTWTCDGGAGTICFDESGPCLVVTHTSDMHAHVAELLASLRKVQAKAKPQVMVQMTVLDVSESFFEESKPNAGCEGAACKERSKKSVVGLNSEQAKAFADRIRTAKEAGQVEVLAAPRLVVTDGETGTVLQGNNTPGSIQAAITPKVSADGKHVMLRVKCSHTTASGAPAVRQAAGSERPEDVLVAVVTNVQTVETMVSLPDGGTSLVLGPARTNAKETRRSVVVMTPRVLTPPTPAAVSVVKPIPAPPVPVAVAPVVQGYAVPLPPPVAPQAAQVYLPLPAPVAPMPVAPAPRPSGPQVMVNMTIVEVGQDFFERVGLDFDKAAVAADPQSKCTAVALSAAQAQALASAVKSGTQAGFLEILSRPQLNLTDGQTGTFQVGQRVPVPASTGSGEAKVEIADTGIITKLTPKVSADGKSVTLRIHYTHSAVNPTPIVLTPADGKPGEVVTTRAVECQTIESTVSLPSGGTGLILGPVRKVERKIEHAVPVLSDIPHVSQLFRAVTTEKEKRQQLIILTPHVVSSPAERAVVIAREAQRMNWSPAPPVAVAPPMVAAGHAVRVTLPQPKPVASLVAAYHKACAEGRTEDAMRCAMQALAIDPKCFSTAK